MKKTNPPLLAPKPKIAGKPLAKITNRGKSMAPVRELFR